MNNWVTILISGLLGVIGGAISGTGKPLVDWHIEKKKQRNAHRRKLLDEWRKSLKLAIDGHKKFIKSDHYLSLRKHMTDDEIKKVEYDDRVHRIVVGANGLSSNAKLSEIDSIINRVAKSWKLD